MIYARYIGDYTYSGLAGGAEPEKPPRGPGFRLHLACLACPGRQLTSGREYEGGSAVLIDTDLVVQARTVCHRGRSTAKFPLQVISDRTGLGGAANKGVPSYPSADIPVQHGGTLSHGERYHEIRCGPSSARRYLPVGKSRYKAARKPDPVTLVGPQG